MFVLIESMRWKTAIRLFLIIKLARHPLAIGVETSLKNRSSPSTPCLTKHRVFALLNWHRTKSATKACPETKTHCLSNLIRKRPARRGMNNWRSGNKNSIKPVLIFSKDKRKYCPVKMLANIANTIHFVASRNSPITFIFSLTISCAMSLLSSAETSMLPS